MDAEYLNSNSFRVLGDETSEFITDRRVKLDCGVDGIIIASVISSTYDSTYTNTTIDETELTSNLVGVLYSVVKPGEEGNIPNHSHSNIEGEGGILNIPNTLLELSDTPTTYSGTDGQYLVSTGSGVVFQNVDEWYSFETDPTVYTYEYPNDTYYLSKSSKTVFQKARPVSYTFTSFLVEDVKSVIFDFADNWGRNDVMGVRAIDFYDDTNTKITITASDGSFYATSTYSTIINPPKYTFITSLSKIGSLDYTSWLSQLVIGVGNVNQRLIIVFNTPLAISRIDVTNNHYSGTNTDIGVKNTKIYTSTDIITDIVYGNTISNSLLIFDGQIARHSAIDEADTHTLVLINNVGDFDTGWDELLSVPKTFLDLDDTPTTYSGGQYLRTTASGIEAIDGIILKAPNETEWLIQVTNSGTLYTVEV